MSYQDKTCICRQCEQEFTFGAELQEEFSKRDFANPTRCPQCRKERTAARKQSRGKNRQTHTAPCSYCGNDAVLPFMPTEGRPVYCTTCFENRLSSKEEKEQTPLAEMPSQEASAPLAHETAAEESFGGFDLDARLERAVRAAGYDSPTPVQTATVPILLDGRDVIGTAQTGTGKTAAFALPILQHLLDNPTQRPCTRVVVLTPTRELAEQVSEAFKQLAKFTKIRTATVYGGVSMTSQERALRTGAEVIVACPGRLLDHIDRGNTDFRNVDKLVLDEADRMLDMGFLPSIKRILSNLPQKRHSMLFSATFAPELDQLAEDAMNDPQRVDVDLQAPAKTVMHALYPCPQHLKTSLILKLLSETDTNSVLIFTRTKHRANRVAQQIERAGYGTSALHANKTQNQRQSALDDFRGGRSQILVATDIAARGLDIESISHVINYDVPDTVDAYIHRIGRTGRMEREGDAMTLVCQEDYPIVWDIERAIGTPIDRKTVEGFDYHASASSANEFRRAPSPKRNSSSGSGRAKPQGSANAGPTRKSSGYYAARRRSDARKASI